MTYSDSGDRLATAKAFKKSWALTVKGGIRETPQQSDA
jgi:hypothetical protein